MKDFQRESLCHDPIHGYIPFVSTVPEGEIAERRMLDHPWVQRMRQIHQLQTAWWVYPSAEHTRFQHVVGAMHMASRAVEALYESLHEACGGDVPSRGYVECLARMAALLHDVGHGPFGHFFDDHFLKKDYGLTHETLGAEIIRRELAPLLRGVRQCPNSRMEAGESLDPEQVAMLIVRPTAADSDRYPLWLVMVRSLFCGLYSVDSMDFVLRDAYMTGYSERAYDLDRILRYSFFSSKGLTIHHRGMNALLKFVQTKSELFRAVYFHRTVRAIDRTLEGLFLESKPYLFSGNPLEHLDEYQQFTEWSLLVDVARWASENDPEMKRIGERWQALLQRQVDWESVYEKNLTFGPGDTEQASIFSSAELVEPAVRNLLPAELSNMKMWIDLPRHLYRPDTRAATSGQNFLYNASGSIRPLTDDILFRQLPISHRMCRVYLPKDAPLDHVREIGKALDELTGGRSQDDLTNM